ncbi:ChbG/HpnK family deacetylase [Methylobacillus gramineus]|uniref:ChbG/HpnK family deacetylase n=1 Tax=Methylobacillus gramineus TaxID=755169 RepID=UPI001CFF6E1C|nr:ChbG/HpnK family deacetylase [Methylobacillus gramineus]MCB5184260.1 ChbG/HpnK family deacetylase [Methylobacillus gramineus]
MSTPLILSADDYAQSDAIDAGILSLIQQKRLTATSCLTLSPRWPLAARRITAEIRYQADIGLHLDFTQYSRIIRYPHPQLIVRTLLRSLDSDKVRSSIRQQLDLFEQAIGTAPDYVDGHQHVHQLPQIRDILLNELASRYSNTLPWIRVATPPSADGFKGRVIGALGSKALKQAARKQGFHTSDVLLGVYGFNDTPAAYARKLRQWLDIAVSDAHEGNICAFMCHPGIGTSLADDDPIWQARPLEYEVLSSDIWPELMQELGIVPIKGSELFEAAR